MRLEKTVCLNSVGERTQRCDGENREWWWYLELVVKRLRCINCLNA